MKPTSNEVKKAKQKLHELTLNYLGTPTRSNHQKLLNQINLVKYLEELNNR